MKTKLFTLLLALLASVGMLFAEEDRFSGKCGNNLNWSYDELTETLTITGTGDMYNYGQDPITYQIRYQPWYPSSFMKDDGTYYVIKHIVLNEGITSIGNFAFTHTIVMCNGDITIPNSVTMIGESAFEGSLGSQIIQPYKVTLGSNVKTIKKNAFRYSKISSINLPEVLETIEREAFSNCFELQNINIPANLKTLGTAVFNNCTNLPLLYSNTIFINLPKTHTGSYDIPSGIERIYESAFKGCTELTNVSIPNSITQIDESAFMDCKNLKKIEFPSNLLIKTSAFSGCSSLAEVTIPQSVTVESYAFSNCSSLKIVYWNAEEAEKDYNNSGPFSGCNNLTDFIIGDNVKSLPSYLCSGLEKLCTLTIPKNINWVGHHIIAKCPNLTTIYWNAINCSDGLYNYKPFTGEETSLTYIIIGDDVTYIPAYLCSIQESTTICSLLGNCPPQSALRSVHIGKNVKTFGGNAFGSISNQDGSDSRISSITIEAITPPLRKNGLNNDGPDRSNCILYVPASSLETYKNAIWWSKFSDIRSIESKVTHTVTFKDWDGKVLFSQNVEDTYPAVALVIPDRDGYTFTGWDKDFSNVTSDLVVTAQYKQKAPDITYYTVTFKDWDGTVLKTEQVEKGGSATAPANPTREGYTFTGWDKDFSNVLSDLIVTAQYKQNAPEITYYTVTFKDWDGTVLKTEQVEEGHSATATATPTREGYTFTGWDKDYSNVQSDLVVTAQYQKNETPEETITVRLKASSVSGWSSVYLWAWTDEGNIFSSWPGQKINKDSEGWYSYTFSQDISNVSIIWNNGSVAQTKDIVGITESTCYALNSTSGTQIIASVVNCPIETIFYNVIFKDWDGTVLKTEQVEEGQSATAPANPTREGYTFIGWDKDYSNVQSDLVVTAQYQKNETPEETITVRLKASSVSGWSSVYLWAWTDEGNIFSSWPGQKINKDSEGWYSYTFSQDISNVSIIWNNGSGAQTKDIIGITKSTCYALDGTSGSNITVSIVDCDTQGVENLYIDTTNSAHKILHNGQLLILRGDKTYTLHGQEVK